MHNSSSKKMCWLYNDCCTAVRWLIIALIAAKQTCLFILRDSLTKKLASMGIEHWPRPFISCDFSKIKFRLIKPVLINSRWPCTLLNSNFESGEERFAYRTLIVGILETAAPILIRMIGIAKWVFNRNVLDPNAQHWIPIDSCNWRIGFQWNPVRQLCKAQGPSNWEPVLLKG
jgi:hypothetical protein